MADRFHVNADGNAYKCFAKYNCPFGDMETDHYEDKESARAAYEEKQQSEMFSTVSKNSSGKKGYSITKLTQIDGDDNHGAMIQMPVKRGFSTHQEAIAWAKENIPHAGLVNITNDDWDSEEAQKKRAEEGYTAQSQESGNWKSLNLVDVSEEAQALETKDIPTIGKYYLKKSGDSITDVHSLRQVTRLAGQKLSPSELGRLRGYLKAATYGKK